MLHRHCIPCPSQLPREGCVLSKPTDDGPVRGVLTSLFADRQHGIVVDLQSRAPRQQVVRGREAGPVGAEWPYCSSSPGASVTLQRGGHPAWLHRCLSAACPDLTPQDSTAAVPARWVRYMLSCESQVTCLVVFNIELDSQVEATWVLALGLKALHVILQVVLHSV